MVHVSGLSAGAFSPSGQTPCTVTTGASGATGCGGVMGSGRFPAVGGCELWAGGAAGGCCPCANNCAAAKTHTNGKCRIIVGKSTSIEMDYDWQNPVNDGPY